MVDSPQHQAFALDLLFETLGRTIDAPEIPTPADFIQLTGTHDIHGWLAQDALRKEVAERAGQIASLDQALLAMRLSWSWRITAPFRWLGDCFRQLWNFSRQ
jgi:hypothetical protein